MPTKSLRGFTLIEVLIVVALSGIAMLALMSFMNFSARSTRSVYLSGDFNSLTAAVRLFLNHEVTCQKVLTAFSFPAVSGSGLPRPIDPPVVISPLSYNGSVVAKVGEPTTGLQVTKLEFNELIDDSLPLMSGEKPYVVNLRLEAKKVVTDGAVGSSTLSSDFVVMILVNPSTNQITGCFLENSAVNTCTEMGGTYSDTTTPKCLMPAVYQ